MTTTQKTIDSLFMSLDIGIAPLIDAGIDEAEIRRLLHELVDQLDYKPTTDL